MKYVEYNIVVTFEVSQGQGQNLVFNVGHCDLMNDVMIFELFDHS